MADRHDLKEELRKLSEAATPSPQGAAPSGPGSRPDGPSPSVSAAAAASIPSATAWQPMETAPRDGTAILLLVPGWERLHVEAAYWSLSGGAFGADRVYPWTTLDPTNGTNGRVDAGSGGPLAWRPYPDPALGTLAREGGDASAAPALPSGPAPAGATPSPTPPPTDRLAELEAALRPFAKLAALYDAERNAGEVFADDTRLQAPDARSVLIGDLRRARAALASGEEGGRSDG